MAGEIVADTWIGGDGREHYKVKMYVVFNGATNAIYGSDNVSSITDNGTGDWTINFISSITKDGVVTPNYSLVFGTYTNRIFGISAQAAPNTRVTCIDLAGAPAEPVLLSCSLIVG